MFTSINNKGRNVLHIDVPSQASWEVREIIDAIKHSTFGNRNLLPQANVSIKKTCNA